MGYYVTIELNSLVIPASRVEECLKAINDLFMPENMTEDKASGSSYYNGEKQSHYGWVNDPPEGGFTNLVDAFAAWRYNADFAQNGDVFVSYFDGEKWGDDPTLYKAIAPFVSENAEIYCRGEDGCHWKYVFKNGEAKECSGKIVYDDE